jgi:hypothetical protein
MGLFCWQHPNREASGSERQTLVAPKTIARVACVSAKQPAASPAGDLYTSTWFKKASAFARQTADEWYILSAKHGLLDPETVIEPYDETLSRMPAAERRAWAHQVLKSLPDVLQPGDRVVILAGKKYRENLIAPIEQLGCSVEVPMEGLRIGEQLRWLNQHIAT